MGWSEERWTAQIVDISTAPEYMNAVVDIIDPEKIVVSGPWNIDTNTPPAVIEDGVIARDVPARINWPLRAVADPGTKDGNPAEVRPGRMAIPWSVYNGPLRTGLLVHVTNGGDNPDLPRYLLRIEEAINASDSASRVMKIAVEGEANTY